jgi:hypothetical protein
VKDLDHWQVQKLSDAEKAGRAFWYIGAMIYVLSRGESYIEMVDGYGWPFSTMEHYVRRHLYADVMGDPIHDRFKTACDRRHRPVAPRYLQAHRADCECSPCETNCFGYDTVGCERSARLTGKET